MKLFFIFGYAFSISFTITAYVLSQNPTPQSESIQVLAYETKVEPLLRISYHAVHIPTPTPSLKPTLSPKPTSQPTPTQKPVEVDISPTPTPDVWSPSDLEPIFSRFAGQYGVDKNTLERIANCESHFNIQAQNGDYAGLFQFSSSTWRTYRIKIGEDPDPMLRFNAEASIKTAAYVISVRGTAPWPSCLR